MDDATNLSFKNENWILIERYVAKYPSDWRLVFKKGDTSLVIDVQVPEEVWRAFDGLKLKDG